MKVKRTKRKRKGIAPAPVMTQMISEKNLKILLAKNAEKTLFLVFYINVQNVITMIFVKSVKLKMFIQIMILSRSKLIINYMN